MRLHGGAVGLHDVVAVVVGLAVGDAGFDPATGHPDGEAARVVVAPVVFIGELALAVGGASELAAPDDEGLVEHAPAL